jgi:hypothetical protein
MEGDRDTYTVTVEPINPSAWGPKTYRVPATSHNKAEDDAKALFYMETGISTRELKCTRCIADSVPEKDWLAAW